MLIEWRTTAPLENNTDDIDLETIPADIVNMLQGMNDPLPRSTVIESRWISLKELAERKAYIIGMDTRTRMMHQASVGVHWSPIVPPAPEGKTQDKSKVGKDKAKPTAEQLCGVSVLSGDAGSAHPLLLALDTTSFFKKGIYIYLYASIYANIHDRDERIPSILSSVKTS